MSGEKTKNGVTPQINQIGDQDEIRPQHLVLNVLPLLHFVTSEHAAVAFESARAQSKVTAVLDECETGCCI
jgi:hypothetical protein